jgi:hypothetical protein
MASLVFVRMIGLPALTLVKGMATLPRLESELSSGSLLLARREFWRLSLRAEENTRNGLLRYARKNARRAGALAQMSDSCVSS